MLDHLELRVADLHAAERFYVGALQPLGYRLVMRDPALGFGTSAAPDFLLRSGRAEPATHFAFRAATRGAVDAAWQAGIESGGRDAGAPRVQAEIHPDYYAAYVFDPAGHKVEFVCHAAPI